MDLLVYFLFILTGMTAGMVGGLLGLGGGIVIVPLLNIILPIIGYPAQYVQHTAVAVSIACMLFISVSSMIVHIRSGNLIWKIALTIAPTVTLGSFVGSTLGSNISGSILSLIFVSYAFIVSWRMFRSSRSDGEIKLVKVNYPLIAIVGNGIGFFSSMIGIGGGALTVPFLSRYLPISRAIAISSTCTFPYAVAGTMGYAFSGVPDELPFNWGFIYIPAFIGISIGSVISSSFGASLAHKTNKNLLKKIFAVFLFIMALIMLQSYLNWIMY